MALNSADTITGTVTAAANAEVVVVKGSQSSPIPIVAGGGGGATSAVTRVAANAASVTLLAANANRVSCGITNSSPGGATLYVKLGAVASLAAGAESYTVPVLPGGFFKTDPGEYSGIIDGIWSAADANGEALITEVTP